MKKKIIHITGDFPDAYSTRKTKAVQNLIAGTPAFEHLIYSINRIDGLGGIRILDSKGNLDTVIYKAPPYGILLETFLNKLADYITDDIRKRNRDPVTLIHAHKLTIEGVVARRVAKNLNCKYICTVRGNTDRKYIIYKLGKRRTYRKIVKNAAHVFPVTPWIKRYVFRKLHLKDTPCTLLPTISGVERIIAPTYSGEILVSAFNLDAWRLKGIPNLLTAIAHLNKSGTRIQLDIIGGGSEKATTSLKREIDRYKLNDQVILRGPIPHDEIQDALNKYAAFVLTSVSETFGMVYVESLFSGIPILYSKDRGIDGFIDNLGVGVRVDALSYKSIARGLVELRANATQMKHSLEVIQKTGGLEVFKKTPVCNSYQNVIEALSGNPP